MAACRFEWIMSQKLAPRTLEMDFYVWLCYRTRTIAKRCPVAHPSSHALAYIWFWI